MNHYQELSQFKNDLKSKGVHGLAVDIDSTLSNTLRHWFKEMARLFGNPENLTPDELIAKYRYGFNVPYWQTPEGKAWMEAQVVNNELQTKFEVLQEADKYLKQIQQIKPVAVYLTIRPHVVKQGTEFWLNKHGFPDAPVITRPVFVVPSAGNAWKAEVLEYLYPEIDGMIDDNAEVLEFLSPEYRGKFFLYSMKGYSHPPHQVICCPAWPDVVAAVKNNY